MHRSHRVRGAARQPKHYSSALGGGYTTRRSVIVASAALETRRQLRDALECEGHQVAEAGTSDATIPEACSGRHDVLIMDSVMNGVAAYGLCRAIRPKSELGIIVLEARVGSGAIDALNAGADDYVTAPFAPEEIAARVRAILRRIPRSRQNQIVLDDRTVDLDCHQVKSQDGVVSRLTPKEFLVLECLIHHAGEPQTHRSLAQAIWERSGTGDVEYLRTVVRQLRQKLEPDPASPQYILTERAVGYRFQSPSKPN